MPLAAAFTTSFAFIYLHKLKDSVPSIIVLQHLYITTLCTNSFVLNCKADAPRVHLSDFSIDVVFMVFLMVVFGYAFQFMNTRANFLKKPSLVGPFAYTSVIVGCIADILIFNVSFDFFTILGIFLASFGLFAKWI